MMTSAAVYKKIKQWIYRGQLQPGERLIESDLARRVGSSRIPLRESLRRLETEGLVRSIPNKATFVEQLSPQDISEIFFMRLLLEPPAARLAATCGSPRSFAYLRRLAGRMKAAAQSEDLRALHGLDYRFHHTIIKISKCRRLRRAYESCHIQIIGPRIDFQNLRWETGELTEAVHTKLVDLLEARRAREAETYVRHTLEQSIKSLDAYFAEAYCPTRHEEA